MAMHKRKNAAGALKKGKGRIPEELNTCRYEYGCRVLRVVAIMYSSNRFGFRSFKNQVQN